MNKTIFKLEVYNFDSETEWSEEFIKLTLGNYKFHWIIVDYVAVQNF